jgi:hypothetical protein
MKFMNSEPPKPSLPPLSPEDYYFENGLMVFTTAYHLKRGYCCGSGCRHCPYRDAENPAPNIDSTPQ